MTGPAPSRCQTDAIAIFVFTFKLFQRFVMLDLILVFIWHNNLSRAKMDDLCSRVEAKN